MTVRQLVCRLLYPMEMSKMEKKNIFSAAFSLLLSCKEQDCRVCCLYGYMKLISQY